MNRQNIGTTPTDQEMINAIYLDIAENAELIRTVNQSFLGDLYDQTEDSNDENISESVRLGIRKALAHAVAPQLSVADELAKLAQLKEAGVLSDDEFGAEKAKLLS